MKARRQTPVLQMAAGAAQQTSDAAVEKHSGSHHDDRDYATQDGVPGDCLTALAVKSCKGRDERFRSSIHPNEQWFHACA
jgi:hypothetical protein